MTHPEIAKVLGLSRQRVQQIEAKALAKLRAAFGSDATGAASEYLADFAGVPEPTGDGTNFGWGNALRASRRFSRWARG